MAVALFTSSTKGSCSGFRVAAMARSTPKDQRIDKMIEAVLHEAKAHKNPLQLFGALL